MGVERVTRYPNTRPSRQHQLLQIEINIDELHFIYGYEILTYLNNLLKLRNQLRFIKMF